ncbi:MAG: DUF2382 domain-containing protein [Jaaginema sp. PMC 1079.18]|nr:DUF2382 domain-containing protein [Jaaginema sp. PMC 1080.18]MEC4851011.1 DUF2382 domain-containing protein [Jaaginema sp. PMC 1079.18]MEC4868764.1 DUF2382 domain-containing protein [Jaaginema sp. PMC 1078.18]
MALYKINDVYPNYDNNFFEGKDIKGMDVYAGANTNEKIGSIEDVLVDEQGYFRYFVVDTGFWIFGKKVLLPIGRSRVEMDRNRVYATGLTNKEQAERLPEYDRDMIVDYEYEERVRGVYRSPSVEQSAPVESTTGTTAATATAGTTANATPSYNRDTYSYKREPEFYNTNERDHNKLHLYEERLITDKKRRETGEVVVGKKVVTETARAEVPVEKEKVVIEVTTPSSERQVSPGKANFKNTEVARMKVHEETADIRKEAYEHGEVKVRKEVERDTVSAKEKLRREELDVDRKGNPRVDRS